MESKWTPPICHPGCRVAGFSNGALTRSSRATARLRRDLAMQQQVFDDFDQLAQPWRVLRGTTALVGRH